MKFILRYLYCIFVALLFLSSCKETLRSEVPNFPIYYELDLRSYEARGLSSLGSVIILNKIDKLGMSLGSGAIAVVRSIDDGEQYFAFDLLCPNDYISRTNLEIDNIYLSCPKCNSKYEIMYGSGGVVEGISKTPLRKYKATMQSNILRITNL